MIKSKILTLKGKLNIINAKIINRANSNQEKSIQKQQS